MTTCAGCGNPIERITDQCNLAPDLSYHSGVGCCPGCQRHADSVAAPFAMPKEAHGTASGYSNYGCRCNPCRQAYAEVQARYRRKQSLVRVS